MKTLLTFTSLEDQAQKLAEIKAAFRIGTRGLSHAMKVPETTLERFCEGRTKMKPVYCQLLGLYLLLKDTQPELFEQLQLFPESSKDKRFKQ